MKIYGYCRQCGHKHGIDFDPLLPCQAMADWYTKHNGHTGVGFQYPARPAGASQVKRTLSRLWDVCVSQPVMWARKRVEAWNEGELLREVPLPAQLAAMLHNADVKTAYAATGAVTITLASLAAAAALLAGRESTAVDNGASNKYLDDLLAGNYRAAASNNQAGTIRTAVVGNQADTPTWPDVFDGTDSTETVTDQPTYDSICRVISDIAGDNTASQTWYWGPVGIAGMFGGWMPDQYVVFVSQSIQTSTNAWSATEGDHAVKRTGVYCTVV